MPNPDPTPEPTATPSKCPACERRKQLFHRRMRRLERLLEIAAIFVHLYRIGETAEHTYVWVATLA